MNHDTAVASNSNGHRHGGGGSGGGVRVGAESQISPSPLPRRQLWKKKSDNNDDDHDFSCIQDLEDRYLMRPLPKSFWEISNNAIVVAQEFSLSCYFLLRYRLFLLQEEEILQLQQRISSSNHPDSSGAKGTLILLQAQQERQWYIDVSTLAMSTALMLVVYFVSLSSQSIQQQQSRKHKVRQRLSDALLLAALLRLLAGVLRTLTASYASDTVTSLVHYGMMIHLLFCDYDYANGKVTTTPTVTNTAGTTTNSHNHGHRRPPFQGGTLSLNAAFFATVVAISRLKSNLTAYLLCSLAVIIFAFYPASRHFISLLQQSCQEEEHATNSTTVNGTSVVEPSSRSSSCWSLVSIVNLYAHWIISAFIIVAVIGLILALETTKTTMTMSTSIPNTGYNSTRLMAWFGGIWLSLVLILPAWKGLVLQKYKKVTRPGCPWDIPTAASMQLHHHSS